MESEKVFGPERLRVYHLALAFARNVERVLFRCRCHPSLRDQLTRATQSVILNIAEGSGHYGGRKKAYYYQIAYGSVAECIGGLARLAEQNPHRNLRPLRRDADMINVMLLSLIRAQARTTGSGRSAPPKDGSSEA